MARNISLNTYGLNTNNNITVTKVEHDQIPIQNISIQELARRDRATIVNRQLTPKKITIEGRITGNDIDDLEHNIETFKSNIIGSNMVFQIQYAYETRNYYVELNSLNISRESYHVTYIPFTMELIAADPVSYGSSYSKSWTNVYTSVYDCTLTAYGSFYPEPIITITVIAATNIGLITFKNNTTGKEIKISMNYSIGDSIIISMITNSITVNGTRTDFTGNLPEFVTGTNKLTATFTGDSRDCDMTLTYQARYI
jgi:hypothetical protein